MVLVPPSLALSLLLGCTPDPEGGPAASVRINEVVAANDGGAIDPADPVCPEHDDWLEIVNVGPESVPLDGLTLSDGSASLWLPSGTLAPGEHLLVWADDQPEQGPLHAPFKVSAEGERLTLALGDWILDQVDVPSIGRDHSWARVRDGDPDWAEVWVPTPGQPNHRVLPNDPCFEPTGGFDDHGYPCMSSAESFHALAGGQANTTLEVVKFHIQAFDRPADRHITFFDTEFYTLHDQPYLFRLLNGQRYEGLSAYPPFDGDFRTWGELDQWSKTVDLASLFPEDMVERVEARLYSQYFYNEVLSEDRSVAAGTLLYRGPTDDEGPAWAFTLEYADTPTHEEVRGIFDTLLAHGPPDLEAMRWVPRSALQQQLADAMVADGLAYGDRIGSYTDLATGGDVEVLHPGLTAGRVRVLRPGESLDEVDPEDILVLTELPDELPPCAALITTVPQTPLSHVSLLARSRGIPNVYMAGLEVDPQWNAWDRRPSWIALQATDDDQVVATDIGAEDYARWRILESPSVPELTPVDPASLPWAIDLATGPDMLALRPQAGGKVAGMAQLLTEPDLDTPDTPLGLTVRGYHRHMASFPWLPALLEAYPFDTDDAAPARYLVLEGLSAYLERYILPEEVLAAETFLAAHPGDQLGILARGEGLRGVVAATELAPDVEAELVGAVASQFAWLPPSQGLRFRSSSTVEDIEGFNGAGLYISATGFLDQDGEDSVSAALRAVWASYWGAEAFEERHHAGIAHLDGGMGVLVHPRFDDDQELSNHVFTATRLPDGGFELLINAQHGTTSVANPPGTCPPVLPESVRVDGDGSIERLTESTEGPPGEVVLDDDQLRTLLDAAQDIVEHWLEVENGDLPPEQQRSVLTLDLESREMASGWPSGTSSAPRLVVKQSRSLEPSTVSFDDDLAALPIPRDLLARASILERTQCEDGDVWASAVHLRTDPLQFPDMGYREAAFVAEVEVLGWPTVDGLRWTHLELDEASVDGDGFTAAADETVLEVGETYVLEGPEGTRAGTATCWSETLWAHPDGFLLELL
jgi:hypothetical protein